MDKKKVTRRAAIGVGIGGVAAAPFIVRALKRSYTVALPSSDGHLQASSSHDRWMQVAKAVGPNRPHEWNFEAYQKEWGQRVEMIAPPIKRSSGPATFTLKYPLQAGTKGRIQSFSAMYSKKVRAKKYGDGEYPQPPFYYTVTDGYVSPRTSVVDNAPALLLAAEKSFTKAPDRDQDILCSECILVPTHVGPEYYEAGRGGVKKVQAFEVNLACYFLAGLVFSRCPIGKPLSKGMKWVSRQTRDEGEFSCEIVDLVVIAGRAAAVIKAEQQVSAPLPPAKVAMLGSGTRQDVIRREKELNAQKLEGIKTVLMTSYVDLDTAIVVHNDWEFSTRVPEAPEREMTTKILSRLDFNA